MNIHRFLFGLLLGVSLFSLFTATKVFSQDTLKRDTLTVGLNESAPFAMSNKGVYSGVSVDLWKNVAENLGVHYKIKEYDQLTDLLSGVKSGEVDVCVSPLTVTSGRIKQFDFTQPYYISNLAIATSTTNRYYLLKFITNFFSLDFLKAVLLLLVVIAIFGFLVWLAERKRNTEMFGHGLKGIGHGIWWSAVTMTTVGYGDKAPVTLTGRVITMVWMFTSIIIISGFTASIASSLTVTQIGSEIKGLQDLRRMKVGSVEGSSAQAFLKGQRVPVRGYGDVGDGLQAIERGRLDAFFYDKPIMQYHIFTNTNLSENLKVLPNTFNTQYYSMAVPMNSPLLSKLNVAILQEIESIKWKAVLNEYNLQR